MKKTILLLTFIIGLITLQAQTICSCGTDYDLFDSLLGQSKKELLDSLDKAGACFESDYSEVRIRTQKGNIKINYQMGTVCRLEWINPPFEYKDIEHILLGNFYLSSSKDIYKLHILRDSNFHFYLTWEGYTKH